MSCVPYVAHSLNPDDYPYWRRMQDKTGTLTQNIMHVENLAIFDSDFESKDFGPVLSNAGPEVRANLSQVISIGAICNAATFKADEPAMEKSGGRSIVGNATGNYMFGIITCLSHIVPCRCCHPPLLRHSCIGGDYTQHLDQCFSQEFQLQDQVHASTCKALLRLSS
jgi:hypothetical protein